MLSEGFMMIEYKVGSSSPSRMALQRKSQSQPLRESSPDFSSPAIRPWVAITFRRSEIDRA
jgi:hypothetical protein